MWLERREESAYRDLVLEMRGSAPHLGHCHARKKLQSGSALAGP